MNFNFSKLLNSKAIVPALAGTSIFAAGVASGVVLEKFVGKPKDISNDVKDTQPRLFDPDNPPPVEERLVITMDDILKGRLPEPDQTSEKPFGDEYPPGVTDGPVDYIPEVMAEKTPSAVPFNVLDSGENPAPAWDWETEVPKRQANPEGPWPICEDEYASSSNTTVILRFYAVDQIMCSDADPREIFYNYPEKLGDFTFGHGASDVDQAYVRSFKDRTDYMIIQMHDSYSESVMGLIAEDEADRSELMHMDRPRKMRRLE